MHGQRFGKCLKLHQNQKKWLKIHYVELYIYDKRSDIMLQTNKHIYIRPSWGYETINKAFLTPKYSVYP